MKKKLIILAIALIVIIAAISLFPSRKSTQTSLYRTQRVINNQLRIAVSATGTINPVMVVNVGTQVSGTIREILVDFNDQVKAGQLMVVLDDEQFRAKVNMTKANLASVEAQLRLAQVKYDRQVNLYKGKTTTLEELDTAKANLAIAQAAVDQMKASLESELYNLNNTRITSPVDGVVINKDVDVGQTVAASFQTPTLIDIAQDLTKMQINASFSEADIGRLKNGQQVLFTVDAFPGENFKGVVRQIRLNPTTVSNVVTYDVVVDVDNPDYRLLPGMTAYVDIELYREDNAVLIPNTALNFRPSTMEKDQDLDKGLSAIQKAKIDTPETKKDMLDFGQFGAGTGTEIFTLDAKGHPQKIEVILGATDQRYTVIREGRIKPGDQVIVGENLPGQENSSLFRMPGRRF